MVPHRRAIPLDCPTCGGSWRRQDGTRLICDRDDDTAHDTAHDAILWERWNNMFRCAHEHFNREAGDPDSERPLCPECDLAAGQEANPGAEPWVHGVGGHFEGLRARTREECGRTAGMSAERDEIPWEAYLDDFMSNETMRVCGGECARCHVLRPPLRPHGFVTCAHQWCTAPAGPIDGQEHLCPPCDLALTTPGVVPVHLADSTDPSYCSRVAEHIRRSKPAVHPQLCPRRVAKYYLRRTGQQSSQVHDCNGCTTEHASRLEESKAPASPPDTAAAPPQARPAPGTPPGPQPFMRQGRWHSTAPRVYESATAPLVVCIVGNIAAGKSAAGAQLAAAGHVVIPEGLNVWGTTLKAFYTSPSR